MSVYPLINPSELERAARERDRKGEEAITAIRSFLRALDNGYLGRISAEDFMIGVPGDRVESAFLRDLRRVAE